MIGFAYHFHLKPWDIDRLTLGEFEVYKAGLDEMLRVAEERQKQSGQPTRKR